MQAISEIMQPNESDACIKYEAEHVITEEVPNRPGLNPWKVYWRQGAFRFNAASTKSRVANVTDVKFIDDTTIVVAHRAAAKLQLLKCSGDSFEIIDELRLRVHWRRLQKFFHPDLIAVAQNRIYMVEYTSRVCIVEVIRGRLRLVNMTSLNSGYFHGCHVHPCGLMLGAVKGLQIPILDLNLKLKQLLCVEAAEASSRIKTIGSEQDGFFIGLDRGTGTSSKSWFNAYKKEDDCLTIIDSLEFDDAQIDGHVFNGKYHFVTMESGAWDTGCIAVIHFDGEKLRLKELFRCNSFPHGLDIRGDVLLYTSYASSSVVKCRLSESLTY